MSMDSLSTVSGISNIASSANKDMVDAQLVSSTLNAMHGVSSSPMGSSATAPITDRATLGGAVVSSTLSAMNTPMGGAASSSWSGDDGGMSSTFQLSQSVLSAHAMGRGTIIDTEG